MYRQLQQKVKRYVIENLDQISGEWKFDIDDMNDSIIVGKKIDGSIIRTHIERFHWVATEELFEGMRILYKITNNCEKSWGGCIMLRIMVGNALNIYGIDYEPCNWVSFSITNKDSTKKIESMLYGIKYGTDIVSYTSPFFGSGFFGYVKEDYVLPVLLLLDPIMYFRKYSDIILKCPNLNRWHTLGIYEMLLEYFPEMDDELFGRYLMVHRMFESVCYDMIGVVGKILVDLWV